MPIKRIALDELLPDLPFVGETNGMAECVNLLPLDGRWRPARKLFDYASLAAAAFPGVGAEINGAAYCSIRDTAIFGVWDNNLKGALYELAASGSLGGITDRSKTSDSSYTRGLDDLRMWRFAEFDSYFVAVGIATVPQKITAAASRFTDLITGTVKPAAKHVCTAKTHLVLGWIRESATDYPRRVWWSSQGDPEVFDVGVARAGFVDIAGSYGEITGLVGFEEGFLCFTPRKVILFQYVGGEEVFFSTEIGSGPDGMSEQAAHSTLRVGGGTVYRSHEGYKIVAGGAVAPLGQGKVRSYLRDVSTSPGPPASPSATDEISGLTLHFGTFGFELGSDLGSALVYSASEDRFSILDLSAMGLPVNLSAVTAFPVFYPAVTFQGIGSAAAGSDNLAAIAWLFWNPDDEEFQAWIGVLTTYATTRQKSRLIEPAPGSASQAKRVRPVIELEEGTGKVVPNVTVELRGWNDLWKKTQAAAVTLDTDTDLNSEGWMLSGLPASAQRWELILSVPEFDSETEYVPINTIGVDVDFDHFAER